VIAIQSTELCLRRTTAVDQTGPNIERLVEQVKAGSREAFESLLGFYEKRVFNFLWQMVRNAHDAEDLTQETFLKAYQSIQRFNSNQNFSTWLFTIAKRTAFNHFRAAKQFEELSPDHEVDLDDPSILLQQKDERTALWTLAEALPPEQREALWLRYAEGFSIAETVAILRTNQIRVRVLLHRARKNLATRLRPQQAQGRETINLTKIK